MYRLLDWKLLESSCAHNMKLYQMDVKSVFPNGYINEEVYVAQPPDFEDDKKPNHVYKLRKALYALCRGYQSGVPQQISPGRTKGQP